MARCAAGFAEANDGFGSKPALGRDPRNVRLAAASGIDGPPRGVSAANSISIRSPRRRGRGAELLRHGVLLDFGAPRQGSLAVGQEYGRATPLADLTGIAPEIALWSGIVVLTRTVSAT
jgi:hypothetical protein